MVHNTWRVNHSLARPRPSPSSVSAVYHVPHWEGPVGHTHTHCTLPLWTPANMGLHEIRNRKASFLVPMSSGHKLLEPRKVHLYKLAHHHCVFDP